MSNTIDNLGLSPRLPNVSSGGMMQNNLTNRVIRNNISINNFKKRTKDSQNQKQLGNWRKRRDIVTKKIGTLSHANRQINDKSTNNNGSNVNNEKMEDHENEEDKLLEFNQAFQDAILATMDREISTYEEQLMDKATQMADITRTKEDLAIALLEEKKRSEMLNKAVITSKKSMKEQQNELALVNLENNGLKQSLESARNNEDEFRSKYKKNEEELQKVRKDLQQMQIMTMAYDILYQCFLLRFHPCNSNISCFFSSFRG